MSKAGATPEISETIIETVPVGIQKKKDNPFRRVQQINKSIQLSVQTTDEEVNDSYILLAAAQVRVKTLHGCSKLVNAICDTGAQANLITKKCADALGLAKKPVKGNLRGLTGFGVQASGQLTTQLFNRFQDRPMFTMNLIVVQEIMPTHPEIQIETEIREEIRARLAVRCY